MLSKNILFIFLFYISLGLVSAFNFKNIIFGDDGDDDVQHQNSVPFGRDVPLTTRSTRPDVDCKGYLCEATNDCVDKPINCPCRLSTEKKCFVGEWYICIRGDQSCEQL